ncbi:hypothetical protein KOW79_004646 [Hemibagrus wyckioides]|uniref:Secreted protein n=1 Tax=Hemibagrus wyckioides TaxID=337641 RepID=A0A9D3SQH5_9TELE|nr:hypothetical protein KOW79_004646 [Hemibagrus wyckioides]
MIFSLSSAPPRPVRMRSSVVLLLMFALSSVPVGAIDTSALAVELSHCALKVCSTEISLCHLIYGHQHMDQFEGGGNLPLR